MGAVPSHESPTDWVVLKGAPSPELLARYERVRAGLGQQAMEMFQRELELIHRRLSLERSRHSTSPPGVRTLMGLGTISISLVALACGTGLTASGLQAPGEIILACWGVATVLRNAGVLWGAVRPSMRRADDSGETRRNPVVRMAIGATGAPEVMQLFARDIVEEDSRPGAR